MARKTPGTLDDSYKRAIVTDWSAGMNTYSGGLALSMNESTVIYNLIPFPGRLLYRGGYDFYSTLTDTADASHEFYDANGTKHFVVWEGGNVYDVVSGAQVLVEAAAYTAGQRVGHVDLNGILYWSTKTVPLRFWNPVAATTGAQPQTGVSPPPASPLLMLYTNAIVAFGVKYGAAAYQPTVMGWSDVNLPGNWDASNAQAIGPLTNSTLEFAIVLGEAEIGVAPLRTFVVGRGDQGIYSYSGALGSLTENVINCPAGCMDGGSAQYIPGVAPFGQIIFFATDQQFWITNGITAKPVSVQADQQRKTGILPTITAQVASLSQPYPRFWSGYHEELQYYFCNVGGLIFVYKWDLGAWSLFSGWPNGPTFWAPDASGVPYMFIASADSSNKGFAKVGQPQIGDNGTAPSIYWQSAFLHMGDPKKFKEFAWACPFFYNTGTTYTVIAATLPRPDGSYMQSEPLTFTTPLAIGAVGATPGIWDSSSWDSSAIWNDVAIVGNTGTPVVNQGRLVSQVAGSGMLAGLTVPDQLKGVAVQFTVSYASGTIDFELLGLEILFKERGYLRDGGPQFNPGGGVTGTSIDVPTLS